MMIYVAAWLMRCNKSKVEIKGFSAGAGPAVTMRNALVVYSPALLIHHTQLTHPLTVAKSLQTIIGGYSGSLLRFIKDHHGIPEEKWGHVMVLQVFPSDGRQPSIHPLHRDSCPPFYYRLLVHILAPGEDPW